jgi:hypothetical protein
VKNQFTYGGEHDFLDSCEPLHADCSIILSVFYIHFCRRFKMQKGSLSCVSFSNNSCQGERLLMFSCKTRGFCPSCHAKRQEEWGEWMRGKLLLDAPHRQVVFTVPKMLRLFFRFKRKLLHSLCLSAVRSLVKFLHTATGFELMPGVVAMRFSPCCSGKSSSGFP